LGRKGDPPQSHGRRDDHACLGRSSGSAPGSAEYRGEAADLLWRFSTILLEKSRLDKRLRLNEAAARGNDRLTQWRRHFEAALAETPILGSNHKEYMRHLREARAQEARILEGRAVRPAERLLQKEN
jgi:hypothetical protein